MDAIQQQPLIFFINGKKVVESHPEPRASLADYIREKLYLTGTKIGCNEGGCGACTVCISEYDPLTNIVSHKSVNACLYPVCATHLKHVITVEGITLHAVQSRLARMHGTQCGFCTPGFIMAMYTLLRNKPHPTTQEVDQALQGNLCRCTGYRPILEAFYSFANDDASLTQLNANLINGMCDKGANCCKNKKECNNGEQRELFHSLSQTITLAKYDASQEIIFPPELANIIKTTDNEQLIRFGNAEHCWLRPTSIKHLTTIARASNDYRFVFGNTEIGIEQRMQPLIYRALVDITSIRRLRETSIEDDKCVIIGAGLSLNEMEQYCSTIVDKYGHSASILREVKSTLHWFAGQHIRNVASWAGNLATASPISDLNPIWIATQTSVCLSSANGDRVVLIDDKFFPKYRTTVMEKDEIIVAVKVQFVNERTIVRTYKQAQRRDDDIAIVNACFYIEFDETDLKRVKNIRMTFGGMAPTVKRAIETERLLTGRPIDQYWLDDGVASLSKEMHLSPGVPGGMEKYRTSLTISFFFKFAHELMDGKQQIHLSQPAPFYATQIFRNGMRHAIGRPIEHLSGEKHTTGEAKYTPDITPPEGTLHMQLVLATEARADIVKIDVARAMQIDGVVRVITYDDLPTKCKTLNNGDTPVFAYQRTRFFGQLLAAVIATNVQAAKDGVKAVQVIYGEKHTPILTIEDAITANSFLIPKPLLLGNTEEGKIDWNKYESDDDVLIIKGQARIGGQEHFYLEPHNTLAIPGERGVLNVETSTQGVSHIQEDISSVLGIGCNKINVQVQRIGGGFGGKETANSIVATPTAVAAHLLKKPVKCCVERQDDMALFGTRHPFLGQYKVALNTKTYKILSLHVKLYSNAGHCLDLSYGVMQRAMWSIDSVYDFGEVQLEGWLCKTNIQSNTAFRGFGGPQSMFIAESMIDCIASRLHIDAKQIREANFYPRNRLVETPYGNDIDALNAHRCWENCIEHSQFDSRKVAVCEFNRSHQYIKRGIAIIPTKFPINFGLNFLSQAGALLHIYIDGSILVSHAGMEMGQGLHTKIVQIVAHELDVPLDLIHIEHTSTDKVPNTSPTAASVGSDLNGRAVLQACEIMKNRLAPIRKRLGSDATWTTVIETAYKELISLSTTGYGFIEIETSDFTTGKKQKGKVFNYFTFGVAVAEVEIDCLTGDHRVRQVDIVMDVGESINPAVDIGQIEGAFIQGYGLTTMEELKCRSDGVWLTRGPGTYKIPSADDCSRVFNVQLLDGSQNTTNIFSSKAIGEPPLFLGSSVLFAIKEAIKSFRADNMRSIDFQLDSPATPEVIRNACAHPLTDLVPTPNATDKKWNIQP